MKRTIMNGVLLIAISITSCKDSVQHTASNPASPNNTYDLPDRPFSKPILIDSANRMIQSYLTSIHPDVNNDAIKSLIFDADLLREYLNDSSQGKIRHMKFLFAHRLSYINDGHFGQRPDSNSNALTMVLIGYGANGNYIYYNNSYALDFCQPCPRECPDFGTASGDLLSQ
ncbi:MAG: hypothetical protein EOP56_02760 [Sphingobacteriales bacterium]|nr:MAG: hypothetical protein EOP56_02760 [Sphingobacteriales bacterium]